VLRCLLSTLDLASVAPGSLYFVMYLAWTILTRHNFDNFARPLFATLLELYSYMGFAEYA
jgi:hypothetical protein